MGILSRLVKGDADTVHDMLAEGIEIGMKSTHAMTGAIVVTDAAKTNVLLRETAHFGGDDYHVEQDLLSKLFDLTKKNGTPFVLPANCRVYLYVYNSPCTVCVDKLNFALKNAWCNGGKNTTVTWKLGFTQYYVKPKKNGHQNISAANLAYTNKLSSVGWNWKQVT